MKPVIALDVGDKRIGVAASDLLGLTAQPLETYTRLNIGKDIRHIAGLARERGAACVVVGLPRNMDGTLGEQAGRTRAFAAKLREAGLEILWIDERLTTAAARRTLIEGGMRREKRKQVIDRIAAVHILETYLQAPSQAKRWEENL